MSDVRAEFDQRLSAFQETFAWEECDALVRSIEIVGDMVGLAFDPVTAARTMAALRMIVGAAPTTVPTGLDAAVANADPDWRHAWSDLDAFNDTYWSTPMARAHDLHAFAYFGILPAWGQPADHQVDSPREFAAVRSFVTETVDHLTRLEALFPRDFSTEGLLMPVERTCRAALARLKLDEGEPVTVHELAALTRVTSKRLQNAIYARSSEAPIMAKDGSISAASAKRWLEARDHLPSIWKEFIAQRGWEAEVGSVPTVEEVEHESPVEYLFVPEAADGTIFGPKSCARSNGQYCVGPKTNEIEYAAYDDALAALSAMATPRWRRPNEHGRFGIVSAQRWRRVSRAELLSL